MAHTGTKLKVSTRPLLDVNDDDEQEVHASDGVAGSSKEERVLESRRRPFPLSGAVLALPLPLPLRVPREKKRMEIFTTRPPAWTEGCRQNYLCLCIDCTNYNSGDGSTTSGVVSERDRIISA